MTPMQEKAYKLWDWLCCNPKDKDDAYHALNLEPDPYDCPACAVAGYEERERIDREKCKKCPMYDAWPTAYGLGSLKRCTSDGSAFGEWEYTDEDEIEKRIASAIIIRDAIRYNWKEKR